MSNCQIKELALIFAMSHDITEKMKIVRTVYQQRGEDGLQWLSLYLVRNYNSPFATPEYLVYYGQIKDFRSELSRKRRKKKPKVKSEEELKKPYADAAEVAREIGERRFSRRNASSSTTKNRTVRNCS